MDTVDAQTKNDILEFIGLILIRFVDNWSDLEIIMTEGDNSIVITLKTIHKVDTGRIIGKEGVTIKAIRTLLSNYTKFKYKKKISIFVLD